MITGCNKDDIQHYFYKLLKIYYDINKLKINTDESKILAILPAPALGPTGGLQPPAIEFQLDSKKVAYIGWYTPPLKVCLRYRLMFMKTDNM